jgi:putative FmdB family regulatory protein
MPIYEYQCNDCDNKFEKMMRFSDADKNPVCPDCHSQNTKKKISSFASLGSFLSGTSVSATSSCGSGGGFT